MVPHSDGSTDLLAPPAKEEAKARPQNVLRACRRMGREGCHGIVLSVLVGFHARMEFGRVKVLAFGLGRHWKHGGLDDDGMIRPAEKVEDGQCLANKTPSSCCRQRFHTEDHSRRYQGPSRAHWE